MALHKIIEQARDEWEHDDCQDGLVQDLIDPLPACLPSSHTNFDEDFDAVSDVAFQDHDVLMLYDMPQVSCRCCLVWFMVGFGSDRVCLLSRQVRQEARGAGPLCRTRHCHRQTALALAL
jgi:hypothetical protein